MDFGVKKENIFVVGAPRFYNYRKKISKSRNEILSQLKINPNKKIILYTSQYIPFNMQRVYYPGYLLTQRDYQEILDTLIATFSELKDFHLILRLRPGADDFNFVQEKISSSGLSNITLINPKEIPIADNINSCDALITHWSTTGMEAMLLNKPLLVFKIKNKEDFVEFLKYKAGYGFNNKKELTILLKNLKKLENKEYSKNQKKYLDEYLGLDKKLNAFEVMLKIIKSNK
jgi:CDP-glycerol glycerophosphotransferase (TagB/SpsB family)